MSFLVVIKKTVVDQAFEPARPAVPEVLDTDGVTVLEPAIPAVPEVPLIEHDEVDRVYTEDSAEQVAKILAAQAADPDAFKNYTFYSLKFNATTLRPQIRTVREKGRTNAPVREIVTIEDQDGTELGSATI